LAQKLHISNTPARHKTIANVINIVVDNVNNCLYETINYNFTDRNTMDVKVFHYLIDALKVAGCSIYEDNIPVLYNSLIKLQGENHFNSVYLWGRIETSTNDYYIAYGHQKDPIENRIFFYT